MGKLNTDFKDDILSEKMNGKKRVKLIPQEDGTYIIEDVTEYTQIGSSYGQKEINLLNNTVNGKLDSEKVIDDLGTALAVTEEGVPVGCKAISALNSNLADSLGGLTFGVDSDGNPGYIKVGADTVTPFKSGVNFTWGICGLSGSINLKNTGKVTLTLLNFLAAGNVNVYGATSSTDLYYNAFCDLYLYGTFAINSGKINIEQVVNTPDINTYPYIVIYPVYATGWSNNSSINICEITT